MAPGWQQNPQAALTLAVPFVPQRPKKNLACSIDVRLIHRTIN